jgi:putative heme transporter
VRTAEDQHPAALAVAGRAAAAACGVLAVSLGAFILWRSAALLALLYVAAMMAVVLDRPVTALVRGGLGRPWALALVLTGSGAIVLAIVVIALGPLVTQARELATTVPAVADRIRAALASRFGDAAPLGGLLHDAMPRGAGALAGSVYSAAGGIASAAGALVTVLVMSVLLLASGPHLVRRVIGAVPAVRRAWAERLAHDLSISLGGYLAGLGVIVAARILATGAFLAIARVPFVMPLALLTGVSVIIPYLGSVLRLLAIGAAAWATRGSGGALAAMSFLAAYDVVENYVLSPIVYRRALGISALGQLFAVLFLGYHLGVAGAVLAIPLAATVQIVSRAILSPVADHVSPATRPESRSAAVDAQRPGREAPAEGPSGDAARLSRRRHE